MTKQMKTFVSNKYQLAVGVQSQEQMVNNVLSAHSDPTVVTCSGSMMQ